ncbi:MAG: NADH-quinone oxidoreductase subunit L [Ilumatobacteraceae bacterium]|nr:NADH-quinone oxidoreductase subunit L [Ilumatobacteraceae bacterium]
MNIFSGETEVLAPLATGWFLENAWLIPVIPAIAFALIILIGKRLPMKGSELGVLSMFGSLVLSAGAGYQWIQRTNSATEEQFVAPVIKSWNWWQSGGFEFGIGQHIDGLSVLVLFVVAFISTLVQVYSLEYLRGDRRYTHFFAALTLFSGGMLAMVLADNTILFLLGWEIMGLCSFMLIGHWWEEDANSRAALKAFFTVRTGDMGLLVGISMLYFAANDWTQENLGLSGFSIRGISAWALSGEPNSTVIMIAAIALFIACIGKSGQFPLHTWLPDAMAGPTPVSSLLHSSTMVVAGVFLVARLYPVFYVGLDIPGGGGNLIVIIGGITIVISAALAFVQNDIKRVLAYSTVSQLGYMMLGLGAGAWLPAVFHIFTHAFFKACLFLGAGSISHSASHHSFDMKKDMGGLRKVMPITFVTWIVSTLALCGVFPFSGFFSKDEIIDNVGYNGYNTFMIIGLVGAFMTAAYMTRATYLTFFGEPRGASAGHADHGDAHASHDAHDNHDSHDNHDAHSASTPHESGLLITVPLMILAVLAMSSGFLNATPFGESWERMKLWVEPRPAEVIEETHSGGPGESLIINLPSSEEGAAKTVCGSAQPESGVCYAPKLKHAPFKWSKAMISMVIVFLGIAISWILSMLLFTKRDPRLVGLTQRVKVLGFGHKLLVNKYYLDDFYEKVIVRTVAYPISRAAYWFNQNILDGILHSFANNTRKISEWVYKNVDQRVVDGTVNNSATFTKSVGTAAQPSQSGKVSQYGALLFSAAAVAALVLVIINT